MGFHNQNVLDPTREILMDLYRSDYYSSQYPTGSGQNDRVSHVFTYEPWGQRSLYARRPGIISKLRLLNAPSAKPPAIRVALQVLRSAKLFKNIRRRKSATTPQTRKLVGSSGKKLKRIKVRKLKHESPAKAIPNLLGKDMIAPDLERIKSLPVERGIRFLSLS